MIMSTESKHLWSHEVDTKWHPPKGFFDRSSEEIAQGLTEASDGLAQAMDRLDFYINRAGTNLSPEDKERLEKVKPLLREYFGE
ncbi:TPA: hypothetical protein DIC20_05245 [Candidatus Dependentiae bacterium]|nr:hypothetical protein [Candidatus Dependentiae bacterium]HCU01071.1 hypothetical protein [Candidatus Dependentiae bacterium]